MDETGCWQHLNLPDSDGWKYESYKIAKEVFNDELVPQTDRWVEYRIVEKYERTTAYSLEPKQTATA
jgi:hypothetical protein